MSYFASSVVDGKLTSLFKLSCNWSDDPLAAGDSDEVSELSNEEDLGCFLCGKGNELERLSNVFGRNLGSFINGVFNLSVRVGPWSEGGVLDGADNQQKRENRGI